MQEGRREERGEEGEGRGGRTAYPQSRNPGYALEMRSTYGKMSYAYCTS